MISSVLLLLLLLFLFLFLLRVDMEEEGGVKGKKEWQRERGRGVAERHDREY